MHGGARLCLLDLREPRVDALPARGDEIDEQREVVDARVTLGEHVSLEALETSNGLVQEAPDLGDVPRDRKHFCSKAVLDGGADLLWQHAFELSSSTGERLDLNAGAFERRLEIRRSGSPGSRLGDPRFRALQSTFVHGHEATLPVGWRPASSTTTCRPS